MSFSCVTVFLLLHSPCACKQQDFKLPSNLQKTPLLLSMRAYPLPLGLGLGSLHVKSYYQLEPDSLVNDTGFPTPAFSVSIRLAGYSIEFGTRVSQTKRGVLGMCHEEKEMLSNAWCVTVFRH
ncbi:hypothetical protein FB451DRAFT_1207399 [Mycena latifolia]|nr:hypothetical protein FB451DRAFT_1207399 [Mycena latifolia]